MYRRAGTLRNTFRKGPEGWCSYDYHASMVAGEQNVFFLTPWEKNGGVDMKITDVLVYELDGQGAWRVRVPSSGRTCSGKRKLFDSCELSRTRTISDLPDRQFSPSKSRKISAGNPHGQRKSD